jgi:hypothetical protein
MSIAMRNNDTTGRSPNGTANPASNGVPTEDFIGIEELARRLGCSPKTVRNKMTGKDAIFQRGVHFDDPPGLPTLFRWSAILALYRFDGERGIPNSAAGARMPGEKRVREIGA